MSAVALPCRLLNRKRERRSYSIVLQNPYPLIPLTPTPTPPSNVARAPTRSAATQTQAQGQDEAIASGNGSQQRHLAPTAPPSPAAPPRYSARNAPARLHLTPYDTQGGPDAGPEVEHHYWSFLSKRNISAAQCTYEVLHGAK